MDVHDERACYPWGRRKLRCHGRGDTARADMDAALRARVVLPRASGATAHVEAISCDQYSLHGDGREGSMLAAARRNLILSVRPPPLSVFHLFLRSPSAVMPSAVPLPHPSGQHLPVRVFFVPILSGLLK